MSGPASLQNVRRPNTYSQGLNNIQPPAAGAGQVQGPANGQGPVVQPPAGGQVEPDQAEPQSRARDLAQRIDILLVNAAKSASKAVSAEKVSAAVDASGIGQVLKGRIATVASAAEKAFKALDGFTGRQLGTALLLKKQSFEWNTKDKTNPAGKAIKAALEAQELLSDLLHKALLSFEGVGDAQVDGEPVQDVLDEMLMQCDRRRSEITTLVFEFADLANKTALERKGAKNVAPDEAALNKMLDRKFGDLLAQKTLTMHGTGAAIEKMKDSFEPLAKRLEEFAKNPSAQLDTETFNEVKLEVSTLRSALEAAEKRGDADRTLLNEAAKLLERVGGMLNDAKTKLTTATLEDFVKSAFPLPPKELGFLDVRYLACLKALSPKLAQALDCRRRIKDAADAFAKDPSDQLLKELERHVNKFASLSRPEISDALNHLAKKVALAFFKGLDGEPIREHLYDFIDDPALIDEFVDKLKDAYDKRIIMIGKDRTCTIPDAFAYFMNTVGIKSQLTHLKEIRNRMKDMNAVEFVSGSAVRSAFNGELRVSTLVNARINGMDDADVDLAVDDSRLEVNRKLGRGKVSCVYELTYKGGETRVFKPEAPGRTGFSNLNLSQGVKDEQTLAKLNMASQRAADALGLGDVFTRTSVGSHNGEFGIFMDKAPGQTADSFITRAKMDKFPRFAKDPSHKPEPGCLSATDIKNLPNDQYAKVIGSLMRKMNRLEWADIITAQGDRHANNYMISVSHGCVTIKGIDNDACFAAFRTGLTTYKISGLYADLFKSSRSELVNLYPMGRRDGIRVRLETDEGVTAGPDGTIIVDTSKVKSPELLYCLEQTLGMKSIAIPDCIDKDLFDKLVALESGEARDDYIKNLKSYLTEDAVKSAVNRLDEAIRHAKSLAERNRVIPTDDWNKQEVQRELAGKSAGGDGALHLLLNKIAPENTKRADEIKRKHNRLTSGYFRRDFLSDIAKDHWFD